MSKYKYTPEDHFKYMLKRKQTPVPDNVIIAIKTEFENNKWEHTIENIKKVLRKRELIEYYDRCEMIKKQLSESPKEQKYHQLDECPICFEENLQNGLQLDCLHIFCQNCINQMINNKDKNCPLCRRQTIKDLLKSKQPKLSDSDIDLIINAFNQINHLSTNHMLAPMDYILYKLSKLLNIDLGYTEMPIKNLARLSMCEQWWKQKCERLGWGYLSD